MRHFDEGDHVDEETRALALRDAGVKQFHLRRRLRENGFERVKQHFKAGDLGAAQFSHNVGTLGLLDAGAPHGALKGASVVILSGFALGLIHAASLSLQTDNGLTQVSVYLRRLSEPSRSAQYGEQLWLKNLVKRDGLSAIRSVAPWRSDASV
jgi:hypothetical protein